MRTALVLLVAFAAPALAADAEVALLDGRFEPAEILVEPGTEVTWVNEDGRGHTVTSSWDDGATFHHVLRPGERVATTFDEEGTWPVHCVPHATRGDDGTWTGMVAVVTVAAAEAEPEEAQEAPFAPLALLTAALVGAAALRRRA